MSSSAVLLDSSMDAKKVKLGFDTHLGARKGYLSVHNPAFEFLMQISHRLQHSLKSHFKNIFNNELSLNGSTQILMEKELRANLDASLDKQLLAWKENSYWVDQPPEIKVNVPKGSLCNLKVQFKAGLPPDAVYNIVTDPNNKRVFKNIKEVISRRVVVDEGLRQVVELEQAAIWRFLWLSGTISVHVFVDQNQKDHTVKFKQGRSGFMKKFEGSWKVEPLFVDEELCYPYKPKSLAEYDSCTGGKGRVGSIVSLEQLIQPAILPPPPFSWYLRGITANTTETLIQDLLAETARLRGAVNDTDSTQEIKLNNSYCVDSSNYSGDDIKERWRHKRNLSRRRRRSSLVEH